MENHLNPKEAPTIVLVHGAYADGSTWNSVIELLQAEGFKTIAVQNPLTSLEDDVIATQRVLNRVKGPIILVGHSWGGMAITQAGQHDSVKSLVYIAAYAPSEGESVIDLKKVFPSSASSDYLTKDSEGFITLSLEGIENHLAQDLNNSVKTKVMYATQTPIRASNFEQKVNMAAWKVKPSYYLISKDDKMIQPELQEYMAERISANIVSLKASHVPHLSQPTEVAKFIADIASKYSKN